MGSTETATPTVQELTMPKVIVEIVEVSAARDVNTAYKELSNPMAFEDMKLPTNSAGAFRVAPSPDGIATCSVKEQLANPSTPEESPDSTGAPALTAPLEEMDTRTISEEILRVMAGPSATPSCTFLEELAYPCSSEEASAGTASPSAKSAFVELTFPTTSESAPGVEVAPTGHATGEASRVTAALDTIAPCSAQEELASLHTSEAASAALDAIATRTAVCEQPLIERSLDEALVDLSEKARKFREDVEGVRRSDKDCPAVLDAVTRQKTVSGQRVGGRGAR